MNQPHSTKKGSLYGTNTSFGLQQQFDVLRKELDDLKVLVLSIDNYLATDATDDTPDYVTPMSPEDSDPISI